MVHMLSKVKTIVIGLVIGVAAFGAGPVYAVNYDVQALIGTYESVTCPAGSNVGQLVPCARHCDNPATANQDETDPCSVCHLIVLGHNIVKYVVYIAVFVALAIITFAGILYIVSAGNEGMISTAKSALKSALFGIFFILVAWVLVNTAIMILKPKAGTFQGNWFQYYCESAETNPTGANGTTPGNTNTTGNEGAIPAGSTGAASKVNPDTYPGTLYCNSSATASGTSYTMSTDQCYADPVYCQNRFSTNCATFASGAVREGTYDYFTLDMEVYTTNADLGESVVSVVSEEYPADTSGADPRQICQAARDANAASGERVVVNFDCTGVILNN